MKKRFVEWAPLRRCMGKGGLRRRGNRGQVGMRKRGTQKGCHFVSYS